MKTVMITGTSSGMGFEAVKLFHAKGWNVVATRRKLADGNPFAELERVQLIELEMNDQQSIERAVQQAVKAFGSIDVLVNNAGYFQMGPLESSTMEQIRNQFETNVFGLISLTKEIIPHMRALKKEGVIINMSSISAENGFPFASVYSASKAAVMVLSEALNMELSAANIQVKAILPGSHASKIFTKIDTAETIPKVYKPLLSQFIAMQGSASASSPADCAKTIYVAATDGKRDRVRYFSGKDAEGIPMMKRLLGIHGYFRFMRKIILNGPGRLMTMMTPELGNKLDISEKLDAWR